MPHDASTLAHYMEIPVSDRDPNTQKEVCYIIRPFTPDVWDVARAVRDAADAAGLAWEDLDLKWNPLTILEGSAGKVRNARVVVAILHKRTDARPNPNVMYELALAHALGKPTLIVTKMDKPVTMINNVPCIALPTETQVRDNTFFNTLLPPLQTLLKSDHEHLFWKDAYRRDSRIPPRLLEKHFHGQVMTLLDFANKLSQRFGQLGSGHVSAMTQSAQSAHSAQQQFEPTSSFEEFKTWMEQYDHFRQVVKRDIYENPKVTLKQAKDTIKAFTISLGTRAQSTNKLWAFFGEIARDMQSWPSMDEAIRAKLREVFGDVPINEYSLSAEDPREADLKTEVYPRLRQMLGTSSTLQVNSATFTKLIHVCAMRQE